MEQGNRVAEHTKSPNPRTDCYEERTFIITVLAAVIFPMTQLRIHATAGIRIALLLLLRDWFDGARYGKLTVMLDFPIPYWIYLNQRFVEGQGRRITMSTRMIYNLSSTTYALVV